MKRTLILFAICALIFSQPVFAHSRANAAEVTSGEEIQETPGQTEHREITVMVDGEKVVFDQPPVIENGRTLVPIRAVAEMIGAKAYWAGETQTARIARGGIAVDLKVGSEIMTVRELKTGKEREVKLEAPPVIHNNRVILPIRAVMEEFGYSVDWDKKSETINIIKPERDFSFSYGDDNSLNLYEYAPDGSWTQYKYNADGSLIIYENAIYGLLRQREFDADLKITKQIQYRADGSMKYFFEYDSNGGHIKTTEYNTDGSVKRWWTYDPVENGNYSRETLYGADGAVLCWWTYDYDINGNRLKETTYKADGTVDSWQLYEHHANGEYSRITLYNSEGVIIRVTEYDEKGNVKEIRTFDQNAFAPTILMN